MCCSTSIPLCHPLSHQRKTEDRQEVEGPMGSLLADHGCGAFLYLQGFSPLAVQFADPLVHPKSSLATGSFYSTVETIGDPKRRAFL